LASVNLHEEGRAEPADVAPGTLAAWGAVFGFLGVGLGAFAAHGLKERLSPEMLTIFETGVRYHLVHAVALFALGLGMDRLTPRLARTAGWLFVGGIVVFSGTLYLLAVTGIRWLGAVTPLGGTALLVGWALLAISAWRRRYRR
jgi:uncharacterized membrane protein YgdD (TMEM256/DUF423 family)